MRPFVPRPSLVAAWLSLPLVLLLAGRGADPLPLGEKPRLHDDEARQLDSPANTAARAGRRQSLPSPGVLDGAGGSNKPRRSWGAPVPVAVDRPSHGDRPPYANDDDAHWGEFLPASSSSSQSGVGFSDDYDPLGGGTFISEVVDPSITHSVFASLPASDTGGPGAGKESTAGQPSEDEVQKLDPVLALPDTDQNSPLELKPQTAPGNDLTGEGFVDEAHNDLGYHGPRNRQEDSPVVNGLSAALSAALSTHGNTESCSCGGSNSPLVHGESQQTHETAQVALSRSGGGGATADTVANEKAAGTPRPGTNEGRIPYDLTEDDVIDEFVDWLLFSLERKGRIRHTHKDVLVSA